MYTQITSFWSKPCNETSRSCRQQTKNPGRLDCFGTAESSLAPSPTQTRYEAKLKCILSWGVLTVLCVINVHPVVAIREEEDLILAEVDGNFPVNRNKVEEI